MINPHPDHAAEQTYLEAACDAHVAYLEEQRQIVDGTKNGGGDRVAAHALREAARERLSKLQAVDDERLMFGRLDFETGKRKVVYIGPCTVKNDQEKVLVVDWTMKIAKPFYAADEQDPQGLMRRRSFDLLERQLLGIDDETFGEEADGEEAPTGRKRDALDRVAAELERAREPRMQAMVATIVADQYKLIEEPREGVLVVQGGPGTGKTAVALHRAVFLVRNNEDLGRVLVVGPNAAFMAYIADVVPGMGEDTVDQLAIDRLAETGEAQARGEDGPEVATLKGDARMAEVVARAVALRTREAVAPQTVTTQGVTVRLTAEAANEILDRERRRERPYAEGRRQFVAAMRTAVETLLRERFSRGLRRRTVDTAALQRFLNTDRGWNNFLERMWPASSAAQILHDLLTTELRLRTTAEGILTEAEISSLLRRGVRTVGVHPWTRDDMPLLDEITALVQGSVKLYGYVIVDEAQDLTPMQLRMIARRSNEGDLTLVGDIAQATGPTRYRDWSEITAHLPTGRGVREGLLTYGYRVPRSIMELANAVLPVIAPELPPTQPVRESITEPLFRRVDELDLGSAVASAVTELAADDRSVGVIVPPALLVTVRGALATTGISVGDISTDQLERRVTLLSSAEAKGLEFDRVVLVEPRQIVTDSRAGWSELYVGLSRATQQLVVVHSLALPAPLPGGEPVDEALPPASASDVSATSSGAGDADVAVDQPDDLDLDLDLDLDTPAVPPQGETNEGAAEDDGAADDVENAEVAEDTPGAVGVDHGSPSDDGPASEVKASSVEEVEATSEVGDDDGAVETVDVAGEPDAPTDADGDATATGDPEAAPGGETAPGDVTVEEDLPGSVSPVSLDIAVLPPIPAIPRVGERDRPVRPADAVTLGGSFSEALVFAKIQHGDQTRRGTPIPYLGHLLATSALVLEDGGTELEAIAALLHDAVEDGGPDTAETIRRQFGEAVATTVIGCTDPVGLDSFRATKLEHLRLLELGSTSVRRVALAEKLDNARTLLRDLHRYGATTWTRMGVEQADLHWYMRELVTLFERTFPSVLAQELRRTVEEIEVLAR
ncbi:HD domain-containing protein [Patulibacter americanus]|uniref:HD domain-containing protein n=1 Tax=Patulibacter americanus TaxID=588672 RepID=UPI0003B3E4AC|nr:HD domain-containing protein [Patulibacter americanus]